MLLAEFDYDLPKKLIAQEPIQPRDCCRLMVLNRKDETIDHRCFYEIADYLKPGDVLVLNKTRVIPCRIVHQMNGRKIEIFLTKKLNNGSFLALVNPGKIFKNDFEIKLGEYTVKVASIKDDGQREFKFVKGNIEELLNKFGEPPFPPYVTERNASFDDYQTVFAQESGSVASPTAGLHFTNGLLRKLLDKGVQIEYVTLHVGIGTFLPVKSKIITDHEMHSEECFMDARTARRLTESKNNGKRIIAVGTTSIRVLESFYNGTSFDNGVKDTNIFIYPGYKWKCVNAVITNFHLPKSTLLMLVSSFAGKEFIFEAYKEAIKKRYRFFSFGDAMFIY